MAYYGAYGTVIKNAGTTIGQVRRISGPDQEKEFIDTTDLATANRERTFISSLRNPGIVEVEVLFDPVLSSQEGVEDAYKADTLATWSIVFSDAAPTTWSFLAITITPINPVANLGDALIGTFRLKLSAAVTMD